MLNSGDILAGLVSLSVSSITCTNSVLLILYSQLHAPSRVTIIFFPSSSSAILEKEIYDTMEYHPRVDLVCTVGYALSMLDIRDINMGDYFGQGTPPQTKPIVSVGRDDPLVQL